MRLSCNATGSERKRLVRTVVEVLHEPPIYQGAPSFAYTIGSFSIDRFGNLDYPANTNLELIKTLMTALKNHGFEVQLAENGSTQLTVEVPLDSFTEEALTNLQKIIANKAVLLKKSLGTENLGIETAEDKLRFPWFTLHGYEGEVIAYNQLVTALCEMAKRQKRVIVKACSTENEKFTLRLFLVRLGFIGNEYKAARKILLMNLTGNSSFKAGHRPARALVNEDFQVENSCVPKAAPTDRLSDVNNDKTDMRGVPYEP